MATGICLGQLEPPDKHETRLTRTGARCAQFARKLDADVICHAGMVAALRAEQMARTNFS